MQITAFGASDVPDVKMSAQSVSASGLEPGVVGGDGGERVVEVGSRADDGSSSSAKRLETSTGRAAGRRSARAAAGGAAR